MMISKKIYENLSKEFGDVASWSIWSKVGEKDSSNTGDMSVFSDPKELDKLGRKIVFIALNASEHADRSDGYTGSWRMFHSDDDAVQKDYKLRYMLVNTPFEGNYITDIIKNHPEKKSDILKKHIRNYPETVSENIKVLKKELKMLGGNPIIIAFGGYAHELLKNNLDTDHTLLKMTHYSHFINKESLRIEAINLLLNNESLKGLVTSEEERERLIADRDENQRIADILEIAKIKNKKEKAEKKAKEELEAKNNK